MTDDAEIIEATAEAIWRALASPDNRGSGTVGIVNAARAALAVVREREGWRPIETAPKDGTPVDLWIPGIGRVTEEWWDDDSWGVPGRPTHWRPLPAAPEEPA